MYMKSIFTKNAYSKGFTLMEVMVSVSIFAIIITIGIGSLLTINNTLQKTRADRQAMDSLSYVLDTMTRQIRTGHEYNGNGSEFSFIRQKGEDSSGGDGEIVTFSLDGDANNQRIYMEIADGGAIDITPPNMKIEELDFETVKGEMEYVTIRISATVQTGRQNSQIAIQTGVSSRIFPSSESNSSSEPELVPDTNPRDPLTGNSVD